MIARLPLHVKHATETPEPGDGWGNPTRTYGEPVEILAYSIGPTYSTERDQLVQTGLVVGLPHSYGITPQDVLVIDGEDWEVVGDLVDANRGPWSDRYRPGFVATVRRAEQ